MPRAPKPLPAQLDPEIHSRELMDLAEERHPLNVQINEFDWRCLQEIAIRRGEEFVSEVVRRAIRREIDEAQDVEQVRQRAIRDLEYELERRDQRKKELAAGD